ncbi:type II toxin-antitoxin system death-on-curing family toxin [Subtercola lobariae]|uniref:Toxin Doc n=1 Tax=Subtercola lobariae TaxID=1588641 RepID=A0A917B936_9MICO|nr:type II toxin-antitoxin system death-on-curing family toxin [Subtercola lobariae]GGF27689.1 toxin Doc [Subtercola lobariae]
MTDYLTLDDALHIVSRLGFYVRDAGLLSSALARPSASLFEVDAYQSIDRKAAALLESLVQNHSLVDGNKRTAWALMIIFLWINGWQHEFTVDEGFALVMGVAEGAIDIDMGERLIAERRVGRRD